MDNTTEDSNELAQLDQLIEREFDKQRVKYEKKLSRRKYNKVVGVPGAHSRFCNKLHQKYDIPARLKVMQVLGDYVKEHPDKYKQDFVINSSTCKYKYLEVQVCTNWISSYPWDRVWIFARKGVYLDDTNDTLFLTLNRGLSKGYLFDIASIKDVKPRRMKKYSREFVYDIPWHRVMSVHMDSLDKETIELY